MNNSVDELIEAAIRDAKLAIEVLATFKETWPKFTAACQMRQMDVAEIYGQRCVGLVESAVDLFLTSHRRIHLYEKIAQELNDG